jgi:hypothetical protein
MKASTMIRLTVLTAAPAHMTRTAARTVGADRGALGRSRIHRPLRIRSAAWASPGRRWPYGAQASSTARISCPFSRRNARGYQASNRR